MMPVMPVHLDMVLANIFLFRDVIGLLCGSPHLQFYGTKAVASLWCPTCGKARCQVAGAAVLTIFFWESQSAW